MGCDIHLFTEIERTIGSEEKWVNCDYWQLNPYYGTDEYKSKLKIVSLFNDRNYTLFSKLANVRNYHGNKYISEPKGLPNDVSEVVKEESDDWGSDGHSHSWFTLKQLIDFFKENGIVKHSGYMTPEDAKLVDKGEMPSSWWQGGNLKDQVYREWEHEDTGLKRLIDKINERKRSEFRLYHEDNEELNDKIRIVFWFDN